MVTAMSIDLYPFNYYVLYASILLLLVFLVLTILRLSPLLKALGEWKEPVGNLTKNVSASSDKVNRISKKVTANVNKVKKILPVLLILAAANEYYKRSDEDGLKEFTRSTMKAIKDKEDQKKLAKAVAKILR